jgi:hypothetical protein
VTADPSAWEVLAAKTYDVQPWLDVLSWTWIGLLVASGVVIALDIARGYKQAARS